MTKLYFMGKLLVALATIVVLSGLFVARAGGAVPAAVAEGDLIPVPSESSAVQAHANAVFERFNGTPYQRDASGVLQAWALNGGMDTCMAQAGYPQWDWSATRNVAPRTNALGASQFFSVPMANSYSAAIVDTASSVRAEEALRSMELSEGEDGAVSVCLSKTSAVSDETAEAASVPEEVQRLRNAWWDMLRRLDERYGSPATYTECVTGLMAQAGLDGSSRDSWQEFLAVRLPPSSAIPKAGEDPGTSSRWDAFLATESQLERIDWNCRADTYVRNLDAVDQAVTDFAADYSAEIEKAAAAWEVVVARAEKLGYRGQEGPI